jgi:plastocyanin
MKHCLHAFALALLAATTQCALAANLTVKVIDREGKPVQDAVVIVKPANASARRPSLPQAVVAQEKMAFSPAVSIAMVGSKVRFINNDPWDHHVRGSAAGAAQLAGDSSSTAKGGFELRLEGKSDGKPAPTAEITLTQTGPVGAALLGCFLHNSMRGSVYVTDTPWTVKTDAQGLALVKDLPEGASVVRVWQNEQVVELPAQSITLSDTQPQAAAIQFQLQVVPRRRRAASPTPSAYSY